MNSIFKTAQEAALFILETSEIVDDLGGTTILGHGNVVIFDDGMAGYMDGDCNFRKIVAVEEKGEVKFHLTSVTLNNVIIPAPERRGCTPADWLVRHMSLTQRLTHKPNCWGT